MPCSDPVPPSNNQYRPLLTQYSMIWRLRPSKQNIFWKHIALATSTALFWSSISKYRPVPPYTDPVLPRNNQCRPLPTKYNQVPISTAFYWRSSSKYQQVVPSTDSVPPNTNRNLKEYQLADLFSTWQHINSYQGSSLTRATCHFLHIYLPVFL